ADRAAGRREDRGVDPDDAAVHVERRPARIALVDRRVDLNEIVVWAGADVAAAGGYDAGGHGAAEAERVADRHHPVAHAGGLLGEFHEWEVAAAIGLDQRDVGARIGADHLGTVGLAIVRYDLHGLRLVNR